MSIPAASGSGGRPNVPPVKPHTAQHSTPSGGSPLSLACVPMSAGREALALRPPVVDFWAFLTALCALPCLSYLVWPTGGLARSSLTPCQPPFSTTPLTLHCSLQGSNFLLAIEVQNLLFCPEQSPPMAHLHTLPQHLLTDHLYSAQKVGLKCHFLQVDLP